MPQVALRIEPENIEDYIPPIITGIRLPDDNKAGRAFHVILTIEHISYCLDVRGIIYEQLSTLLISIFQPDKC